MRVALHPSLTVVWREPGTLQIGLDPDTGLVLADLGDGDERIIEALRSGLLSREGLLRLGRRQGLPEGRVGDLLDLLAERGALIDHTAPGLPEAQRRGLTPVAHATALRYEHCTGWDVVTRRLASTVLVRGACRAGLRAIAALQRAGVGTVLVDDDAIVTVADVGVDGYPAQALGRRRAAAAAAGLGVRACDVRDGDPDLALIIGHRALAAHTHDGLLRHDVPHLPLVLRERDAVVGPLVEPGRTCCLRCVDLYRADRDPQWLTVVRQIGGRPGPIPDPTLLDSAVGLLVSEALLALDRRRRPTSWGASIAVRLDDPVPVIRRWPAHVRCGCTWPPPNP